MVDTTASQTLSGSAATSIECSSMKGRSAIAAI
jgi:hypothetical protein